MMQDFHKEFELAKKVIVDASHIVLRYSKKQLQIDFKNDISYLTQADGECEEYIKKELQKQFPSYGFIGEETGADLKNIAWIVDPIDGTAAFAHNLPDFGMTISLKAGKEMIFSVQYLPMFSKLISAYKNEGAFEENKKITVSTVGDLHAALISFGPENMRKNSYQAYTTKLLEHIRYQSGHSSVVESYYLASGKTDIFVRCEQKLWDVAPAYILMKEAGAVITDLYGKPLELTLDPTVFHSYVATNKELSKKYKALLYKSE